MHEILNAQSLSAAGLGNLIRDSLGKALSALKSWFSNENPFTRYLSGLQQVFDSAFNQIRARIEENPVLAIGFIIGAVILALLIGPALVGRTIASTLKGMGRAIGGFFGGIRVAVRSAVRA